MPILAPPQQGGGEKKEHLTYAEVKLISTHPPTYPPTHLPTQVATLSLSHLHLRHAHPPTHLPAHPLTHLFRSPLSP